MSRSLLFLFSALMLAPAAAFGDPYDTEVRSEVVHFGDLNLKEQPDAGIMADRIHHAARHVCANPGVRELGHRVEEQDCRVDAEERGVADTNAPLVTAEYYGVTPQVVIEDEGFIVKK